MNPWKPIDKLGYAIATWWKPKRQLRTGVLSFLLGLLLMAAVFASGEPPLIYEMSALALVLGGLGIIVTAVLAVKEDPELSEDDLLPKEDE